MVKQLPDANVENCKRIERMHRADQRREIFSQFPGLQNYKIMDSIQMMLLAVN